MDPELLKRTDGILKLRPTFVHRFYPDLNRLGQSRLRTHPGQFIPERWIGSSVQAINPRPLPGGGLSIIDEVKPSLSLRDAIRAWPEAMLGSELLSAHGPEFRVLVKLLDPGEPIVFHLHATDAQVMRMRRNFRNHRFGKDEAYYFLDAPKGPMPYTHLGLHSGVSRQELIDAVRKGPQYALELSPVVYQAYETGYFVPAGVPHRPGTALTLEVQQPSDVYTLLETRAGGRAMNPAQIHPGFRSLEDAFGLIDMKTSARVGELVHNRLLPKCKRVRGGELATIFPAGICRKFVGKRIRVSGTMCYRESLPFVVLVWGGRGTIDSTPVRRGDEFFISHAPASRGVEIRNSGSEPLELFSFMPVIRL